MRNSKKPAYPVSENDLTELLGLTKREYFAAMAMQGELCGSKDRTISDCCNFIGIEQKDYQWQNHYPLVMAKISVLHADALLAELDKTQQP